MLIGLLVAGSPSSPRAASKAEAVAGVWLASTEGEIKIGVVPDNDSNDFGFVYFTCNKSAKTARGLLEIEPAVLGSIIAKEAYLRLLWRVGSSEQEEIASRIQLMDAGRYAWAVEVSVDQDLFDLWLKPGALELRLIDRNAPSASTTFKTYRLPDQKRADAARRFIAACFL